MSSRHLPGSPADAARAERPRTLLDRVSAEEIPPSSDILAAEDLRAALRASGEPPYSVLIAGDIMLGERAAAPIERFGHDYPFRAVLPLLETASVVFGNLEGPLAEATWRRPRRHAYAVDPSLAFSLASAGIDLVTLANNHITDCGPEGVRRTLDALHSAGVMTVGGGVDLEQAHVPAVRAVGPLHVGFLGYYWHQRCAAGRGVPGVALDTPGRLESDIGALRRRVDRVIVAFHWGIPYHRDPLQEDVAKARYAIDCGADLVVGHHPHVVQPFEIYRGRPIFYSVGNFAFGTGNSRAEGILLGIRFEEHGRTTVDIFPMYVKNRDPRVNCQPKVLAGRSSTRILSLLATLSAQYGAALRIDDVRGRLEV